MPSHINMLAPSLLNLTFIVSILWSLGFPSTVFCYIPAYPTNSTQDAVAAGLNLTDISTFFVKWSEDVNGSYVQHIAYQMAKKQTKGVNEGVLLHLSEDSVNTDTLPTKTPWIALISCDANSTNASPTRDIFTLAHEKGAMAAVIYSSFSEACVITSFFSSSTPPFDIFASQTPTSSYLISSYLFAAHITPFPGSPDSYSTATSAMLNASEGDIVRAVNGGYPAKGYLLATLKVWNATRDGELFPSASASSASARSSASVISGSDGPGNPSPSSSARTFVLLGTDPDVLLATFLLALATVYACFARKLY